MEKRIRIVWCLTIITLILITTGQIYWIYKQVIYQQINKGKDLFVKCDSLIKEEDVIRSARSNKQGMSPYSKDIFMTYVSFDISSSQNPHKPKITLYQLRENGEKKDTIKKFNIDHLSSEASSPLMHRLNLCATSKFDTKILDSLFISSSVHKPEDYQYFKINIINYQATYTITTGMNSCLIITYPYNPLEYKAIRFKVPVGVEPILKSMAWQLAGSIFLFLLLVICMFYQIKTILFQKRIDGIRKEFMKNMIYEMKQAAIPEEATDDYVMIGNTKFYYSMNELHYGEKTVIVTSRQAEIIKILSDKVNEVVSRSEILEKVWGDDSYSNSMALNVQITYIRRAFSSDNSISIEAIMKKGYLLKVAK